MGDTRTTTALRASIATALLACAFAANAYGDGDAKQLPPEAQAAAEGIAQGLLQVHDTETGLSCDKAVENARYGLETMLEVGRRNADGGYIDRADFEAKAVKLRAALAEVTPQDCAAASGAKQAFYRCMSSDYNHVAACAAAHRF